jgi:lipocalin-like protein
MHIVLISLRYAPPAGAMGASLVVKWCLKFLSAVYWEGAVRAFENATPVGRGYLDLTGYVRPLRL